MYVECQHLKRIVSCLVQFNDYSATLRYVQFCYLFMEISLAVHVFNVAGVEF